MDTLNTLRIQQLNNALSRLDEAFSLWKSYKPDNILYPHLRDSVIQRFEFTADIFWKRLKEFLAEAHKINVASPKSTFQECYNQKIIDASEYSSLLDMIDDRNNTSHRYNEEMAEIIAARTHGHSALIHAIVQRIS